MSFLAPKQRRQVDAGHAAQRERDGAGGEESRHLQRLRLATPFAIEGAVPRDVEFVGTLRAIAVGSIRHEPAVRDGPIDERGDLVLGQDAARAEQAHAVV